MFLFPSFHPSFFPYFLLSFLPSFPLSRRLYILLSPGRLQAVEQQQQSSGRWLPKMELSQLPGWIRNWILFLFCYPSGPDPVSPPRGMRVSDDGVGGRAGGTAGLDLCQVAVTGAPQWAHIRPHLYPQNQAVCLGSRCSRPGV